MATLEGDLTEKGAFTVRFRVPKGYVVPPHTHPAIEHITVISGTLNVGMGRTLEKEKGEELSAGDFAFMEPGMEHYVWATEDTVLQLHGIGPWGITYVNRADDPRRRVRGEEESPDEQP